MKYSVILMALACIGFTSCQKDYTCECKYVKDQSLYISYPVNSVREDDAKTKCTSYESKLAANGETGIECLISTK